MGFWAKGLGDYMLALKIIGGIVLVIVGLFIWIVNSIGGDKYEQGG